MQDTTVVACMFTGGMPTPKKVVKPHTVNSLFGAHTPNFGMELGQAI